MKNRRPNIRSFFTNLSAPMPWYEKVYKLLNNNLLKLIKVKNCCGHFGEPGC